MASVISRRGTKALSEWTLLNGLAATSTGFWADVSSMDKVTVDINGITVATCQIMGSCAPTIPTDATDGFIIGSNVTANIIYEVPTPLKYIKVKVQAYTSGTIYAYCVGRGKVYGM